MQFLTIVFLGFAFLGQLPKGIDRTVTNPRTTAVNPRIDRALLFSGKVTGVVTDKSGAGLPGVEVTLAFPDGSTQTTVTGADGRYTFEKIAVGQKYSVRFSRPGFKVIYRPNVLVKKNSTSTVNMQLESGPVPTPTAAPSPRATALPSPIVSPTAAPSPFINGTPTPTPSETPANDWNAIVAREMGKLQESKIVFNPPLQMQQGKTERIEVRISSQDIGPALTTGLQGRGTPQVQNIKVSSIMKVALTGDSGAFTIDPLSDEEQIVAGLPFATWRWDVTPLYSGVHTLHLKVVAVVHIPERGDRATDIPIDDKPIQVQVNAWFATKTFIGNNWQWLWTVIVVPGAGLIWGLRRRKKRKR
jgi:Carboxypeptidase regulatory-like domain